MTAAELDRRRDDLLRALDEADPPIEERKARLGERFWTVPAARAPDALSRHRRRAHGRSAPL